VIKFKPLKYKHFLAAQELYRKIDAGQAGEHDVLVYELSLIAEWDFVDAETGEALPIAQESLGELSLAQYREMIHFFNSEFAVTIQEESEIPKESA
jgi:hypothetical protein